MRPVLEADLQALRVVDVVGEQGSGIALEALGDGAGRHSDEGWDAARAERGGAPIGQWILRDHGKGRHPVRIAAREGAAEPLRLRRRVGRSLGARLEHDEVHAEGRVAPGSGHPVREAAAHDLVAKVRHGEEVVVRHDGHGDGVAAAGATEVGQDSIVLPVGAAGRPADGQGQDHAGQGGWWREGPERHRDLENARGQHARAGGAAPRGRERAQAHGRDEHGRRQDGKRVAQVLVLDQREEHEGPQGGEPEKAAGRPPLLAEGPQPPEEQEGGDEAELGRQGPRVERERRRRQGVGILLLGGLLEGAIEHLGGESEEPGAIPGKRQGRAHHERAGRPEEPPAALGGGEGAPEAPEEGRDDIGGEGRLGQHAEAEGRPQGERPAGPPEILRSDDGVERQRHHGGQGQIELEVGQREDDEGRGGEEEGGPESSLDVGEATAETVDAGEG